MALRRTQCWDETVEKMRAQFPTGIWLFSHTRAATKLSSEGDPTQERHEIQKGEAVIATAVSFKRTKNPNKMEICAQVLLSSGVLCKISLFLSNPHFIVDIRYNPHLELGVKIL